MGLAAFSPRKFRRRVFGQLWMLALQFMLGMILNLLGNNRGGAEHAVYNTVLIAHIVNAIGLLEGSIYIALKEQNKWAWWSVVAISVTFSAGVLTILTNQGTWSFVMAVGFLTSAWLYIVLYVGADRRIR